MNFQSFMLLARWSDAQAQVAHCLAGRYKNQIIFSQGSAAAVFRIGVLQINLVCYVPNIIEIDQRL